MENICACIVTFNPNLARLQQNIEVLDKDVEQDFIIDNNSKNSVDIVNNCRFYKKVVIDIFNENKGITYALNTVLETARINGYQWCVTMDQDSILDVQFLKNSFQYLDINNVGIISPSSEKGEKGITKIKRCITSGSITNINAWQKVGGFDSEFFIDYVDFDFCAKLIDNGFDILSLYGYPLDHQLGNLKIKYIFGIKINTYNHSAHENLLLSKKFYNFYEKEI